MPTIPITPLARLSKQSIPHLPSLSPSSSSPSRSLSLSLSLSLSPHLRRSALRTISTTSILPKITPNLSRAFSTSSLSRTSTQDITLRAVNTPVLEPDETYPSSGSGSPLVHCFFDKTTGTWTYVVVEIPSSEENIPFSQFTKAIVIDPIIEFEPSTGRVGTDAVKRLAKFIEAKGYEVVLIADTHVHADHLSGARVLKRLLPNSPPTGIGSNVSLVQKNFAPVYDIATDSFDHSFDIFFNEGPIDIVFNLGKERGFGVKAIELPGHTPDSMGILVGDSIFCGDSLFQPDLGTARTDFPGGDAKQLYSSISKILALPPDTRIFTGHDYPSGRPPSCLSSPRTQLKSNNFVRKSESEFIALREAKDATLAAPRLMHPSVQFNIRGGRAPEAGVVGKDENGKARRWLRIPVRGEMDAVK